jgi:predicted small lipoprotein YifL
MTMKLIALTLIALSLAACGVRGDPEPPPQFQQAQ